MQMCKRRASTKLIEYDRKDKRILSKCLEIIICQVTWVLSFYTTGYLFFLKKKKGRDLSNPNKRIRWNMIKQWIKNLLCNHIIPVTFNDKCYEERKNRRDKNGAFFSLFWIWNHIQFFYESENTVFLLSELKIKMTAYWRFILSVI